MGLAKLLRNISIAAVVGIGVPAAVNYHQHHNKAEHWLYAKIYTKMDGPFSWTEVTLTDKKTIVTYKSWILKDVILSDTNLNGKVDERLVTKNGILNYEAKTFVRKSDMHDSFKETLYRFGFK